MWYHWLNGYKFHVLKAIKSKLIGIQIEIWKIWTCKQKIKNQEKKH